LRLSWQVLGGLPDGSSLAKIAALRGGATQSGSCDDLGRHADSHDADTGYSAELCAGPMACFKESLARDAAALSALATGSRVVRDMDSGAAAVVKAVAECKGTVHVTGLGKSGLVGRRLAASLASLGTKAHFTHAAEWAHGDLGKRVTERWGVHGRRRHREPRAAPLSHPLAIP